MARDLRTRRQKGRRIPLPLAMVLGALAGAAYVILLPFVGLALLAYALALRAGRSLGVAGRAFLELAATPGWLPGHSYLGRYLSRRRRPEDLAQRVEEEMKELARRARECGEGRE